MKIKILLGIFILLSFIPACQTADSTGEKNAADAPKNENAKTETAENKNQPVAASDKKQEFTGELKFPFEFPAVDTSAKEGEKVLVPSYNWLVDAVQKDPKTVTMIWYAQEMAEPGAEKSKVKYMRETKEVPNAYIIPLGKGEKAKKGDILLTWWQTGSGLQRAIVTDDANPAEPVVRYLDLDYDNPAKSRDGQTTIGQMDEKIKPDTFKVIKAELEPGTAVACGDGLEHGQVVRVAGDKIFIMKFAGKIDVKPKSECKAVPLRPNVKAGDRVKAVWVGSFKDGTVTKADNAIGRVWVKFDQGGTEKVISFGDVYKQ
jgi:hypothetical protein